MKEKTKTKESGVVDRNRQLAKARVRSEWRNGAKAGTPAIDRWACDIVYLEHGTPRVRDAWFKNRAECPEIPVGEIIWCELYTGSDGVRYCDLVDCTGLDDLK